MGMVFCGYRRIVAPRALHSNDLLGSRFIPVTTPARTWPCPIPFLETPLPLTEVVEQRECSTPDGIPMSETRCS